VTWLQFNAHLLRLTGEARFAEQLERVVLNQLFGAEQCDGTAWGYYIQMEGKKPYSAVLDGHCCLSSGPRGVALIPTFVETTDAEGVVVNLYEKGSANLNLRDGTAVTLVTDTRYPVDGHIDIKVSPEKKKTFDIKVRIPEWCEKSSIKVNGKKVSTKAGADGYVAMRREWNKGDTVQLDFDIEPRVIVGSHKNAGKAAILYGPLVLAVDDALLDTKKLDVEDIGLASAKLSTLKFTPEPAPEKVKTWPAAEVFRINAETRKTGESVPVEMIPFADAGGTGTAYKVWLPYGKPAANRNLLLDGLESRSRKINMGGSIIDGDAQTFADTFTGKSQPQDWYSVTLNQPVKVGEVVFVQGRTQHNGGWFDASADKPRIQVKTDANGNWENVGKLDDYPATTVTDAANLKGGERFVCKLKQPIEIVAIRVIGKPASGDNAQQAYSTCAELQAFAAHE
jgi:hypothetical protein